MGRCRMEAALDVVPRKVVSGVNAQSGCYFEVWKLKHYEVRDSIPIPEGIYERREKTTVLTQKAKGEILTRVTIEVESVTTLPVTEPEQ